MNSLIYGTVMVLYGCMLVLTFGTPISPLPCNSAAPLLAVDAATPTCKDTQNSRLMLCWWTQKLLFQLEGTLEISIQNQEYHRGWSHRMSLCLQHHLGRNHSPGHTMGSRGTVCSPESFTRLHYGQPRNSMQPRIIHQVILWAAEE